MTTKVTILCSRKNQECYKLKRLATHIPEGIKAVKKIVDGKLAAFPYIKSNIIDSHLVKNHFKGHELWFTMTIYAARRRWKRFLQTCKMDASWAGKEKRPKGNQGVILLPKCRQMVIWELVIKADKAEAKELITEYGVYRRNIKELPQAVQEDWEHTKPTNYTKKSILNHFYLRDEEIEAKKLYRQGKIREAMEITRSLFHLPPSTGGGLHYK